MSQTKSLHSANRYYTDNGGESYNLLKALGYDGCDGLAPLGLSLCTYLTARCQTQAVEVAIDGQAVRRIPLEPRDEGGNKQVGGGARGCVRTFSRQSRNRLQWKLSNLRGGAMEPGLFITLTYPAGEFTAVESKQHLDVFIKRLRRRFPAAAGMWKLEYQKNGTPHYHLLVLGISCWLIADVSKCWAQVVKSNHPAHERVGTQVQPIMSQRHAGYYMSKYVAKEGQMPTDHRGRIWGTFGELERFESRKVVYGLTRGEVTKLRRVMDAWRAAHSKKGFKRPASVECGQRWYMPGLAAYEIIEGVLRESEDRPPGLMEC